jgi:type VI secretion system secreted protein Hcp
MALPIYIEIEGTKQGKFEGGCKRKGREKMIEGLQAHHGVDVPTDRMSGKITGNRVHGPFTFTKEIDKASVPILQALVTGETIKTMTVHFWHITPEGKEVELYNIVLEDAQICSVNTILPNIKQEGQLNPMEEVSLRYSTVTWTFLDGNLTVTDSWLTPVA